MVFQCINIRQVPLEVLKTAAFGLGFQHLPRDWRMLMHEKPCLIPIVANSAVDEKKLIFFLFCSQKTDFDISYKVSPILGKHKKNISKYSLLIFLPNMLSVTMRLSIHFIISR